MIPIGEVPSVVEDEYGWKPALGTVRCWVREGRVKGVKFGGRVFVVAESLHDIVESMKKENGDAEVQA